MSNSSTNSARMGANSDCADESATIASVPARFQGQTLYEVLGITKDATPDAVKKAYRRMALSCHPDLNKSPNATEEFQYLSRCHEVLSDSSKRALYDETGSIDGTQSGSDESMDAYEYWRTIFPKISLEDIEAYRTKYEGSEEEKEDLVQAWEQCQGDLESIFECVPFASASSVTRLCTILNTAVGAKINKKRQTELKRSLDAMENDEAAEAEAAMDQLSEKEQKLLRGNGNGGSSSSAASMDGLALIIQQRAKDRAKNGESFLAQMEMKYAGKSETSKRSSSKRKGECDDEDELAPTTEMSDADFEAIQAKLMANKKTAAKPTKKSKK